MKRYFIILALAILPAIAVAQQHPWQQGGNTPQPWRPGQQVPGFNMPQPQQFSPEAYKKHLEQYITEHAGLTQQEGQKFFPMLHEMMAKQREVQGKRHANLRKGNEAKNEVDFEKLLNQNAELSIEESRIELMYYKKFHRVLSWEKIYKVNGALYMFNMEALRRFTPQRPAGQWPGQQRQNKK